MKRGIFLLLLILSGSAFAASPVGRWTTVDDETGKVRSVVQISQGRGGVLSGRILQVYKQAGDTGYCRKCPGSFKNKPVKGLRFMWGLKPDGERRWAGGKILDPKKGKIYKCKIELSQDGKRLNVRGYVGVSLFGRTQTWRRK